MVVERRVRERWERVETEVDGLENVGMGNGRRESEKGYSAAAALGEGGEEEESLSRRHLACRRSLHRDDCCPTFLRVEVGTDGCCSLGGGLGQGKMRVLGPWIQEGQKFRLVPPLARIFGFI